MKHKTPSSFFFLIIVVVFGTSCDTTSIIQESEHYRSNNIAIKAVDVPYQALYGPAVTQDMFDGSIERFPTKSNNKGAGDLTPSAFGCRYSWANLTKNAEHNYSYYKKVLYFKKSWIERAKGRYKYLTSKAISHEGPKENTMGIMKCILPYTDNIDSIMERLFENVGRNYTPDVKFTMETVSRELSPTYYKDNQ